MRTRKSWRRPRGLESDSYTSAGERLSGDKRQAARSHGGDRKLRQLCRQVADTLGLVLSGECNDDVLRSLHVVAVTPAPDAAQLLVLVAPALAEDRLDPADVLTRLAASSGRLRYEVAAAITRKRAPR